MAYLTPVTMNRFHLLGYINKNMHRNFHFKLVGINALTTAGEKSMTVDLSGRRADICVKQTS